MSSESSDTRNSERRAELAKRFKQETNKQDKNRKVGQFWRVSRDMIRDIAPAYGVAPALISRLWRENYSSDVVELLKGDAQLAGLDHVYAYPKRFKQKAFLELLSKGTLADNELWKFFVRCRELTTSPVVLFTVNPKQTWVLTTADTCGPKTQYLVPRLWVPVPESSQSVMILPATLFVEEHNEQ